MINLELDPVVTLLTAWLRFSQKPWSIEKDIFDLVQFFDFTFCPHQEIRKRYFLVRLQSLFVRFVGLQENCSNETIASKGNKDSCCDCVHKNDRLRVMDMCKIIFHLLRSPNIEETEWVGRLFKMMAMVNYTAIS